MKIRYYGFMNSACSMALSTVSDIIKSTLRLLSQSTLCKKKLPQMPTFPHCEGT